MDSNEEDWIRKNIKHRECRRPVRAPSTVFELASNECECGRCLEDHKRVFSNTDADELRVWSKWQCTVLCETNAFGNYVVEGKTYSIKYVRLDEDTDMDLVQDLLVKTWGIPKPGIILSVFGVKIQWKGNKNNFETSFQDFLEMISRKQSVWILIAGNMKGLDAKALKAAEICQTTSQNEIVTIKIMPWGLMENQTSFIRTSEGSTLPAMENKIENQPKKSLNFALLVDNGTKNIDSCIASVWQFSNRLQVCLSEKLKETSRVPRLAFIYGEYEIRHLETALEQDTPVIITKGYGGVAEDLANGYKDVLHTGRKRGISSAFPVIRKTFWDRLNHHPVSYIQSIQRCLQRIHLLTNYELTRFSNCLISSVLQALIKANSGDMAVWTGSVLDNPGPDTNYILKKVAMEAILFEKLDIVESIMNHRDIESSLFSAEFLVHLYNRSFKSLPSVLQKERSIEMCLSKAVSYDPELEQFSGEGLPNSGDHFSRPYGKAMSKLLHFCEKHLNDEYQVDIKMSINFTDSFCAEKQLFTWALLANKQNAARFFWLKGKDLFVSAVFASVLLDFFALKSKHRDQKDMFSAHARLFKDRASGTLNACCQNDKTKTHELLVNMRTRNQWHCDWLELALTRSTDNTSRLFSTEACKEYIDHMWRAPISSKTSMLWIILGVFLFPLICCKCGVRFKKTFRHASACIKFFSFYQSPIVKVITSTVTHTVFLAVFAHLLLFDLRPEFTPLEAAVGVYVFATGVEEIVQLARKGFMLYISDWWNKLDIACLLVYVMGIILRVLPYDASFTWARIVLGLDHMLFFWRILFLCSINQNLGPKLVMISKMVKRDLIPFLVILLVFLGSYAVASESILYPNSVWSVQAVLRVPKTAFYAIFGEFPLDDIEAVPCTDDPNAAAIDSGMSRCPTPESKYFIPIFLAFYILCTNVLLLNILIALFNHTFQGLQSRSDEIWGWQSCNQVLEFKARLFLPVPFSLIVRCLQILIWPCCKLIKQRKQPSFKEKNEMEHSDDSSAHSLENSFKNMPSVGKVKEQSEDVKDGEMEFMPLVEMKKYRSPDTMGEYVKQDAIQPLSGKIEEEDNDNSQSMSLKAPKNKEHLHDTSSKTDHIPETGDVSLNKEAMVSQSSERMSDGNFSQLKKQILVDGTGEKNLDGCLSTFENSTEKVSVESQPEEKDNTYSSIQELISVKSKNAEKSLEDHNVAPEQATGKGKGKDISADNDQKEHSIRHVENLEGDKKELSGLFGTRNIVQPIDSFELYRTESVDKSTVLRRLREKVNCSMHRDNASYRGSSYNGSHISFCLYESADSLSDSDWDLSNDDLAEETLEMWERSMGEVYLATVVDKTV